jgi:putative transposase
MQPVSYARHRFPPDVIRHAVWLYVRFTLSYRDVEELLAERGLDISYETVRRWVLKFGPLFACRLRPRRPRPSSQWHLDEMAVTIAGKRFWLWRAVDSEGEILDLLVAPRRDKAAALKLMRKLLKKQGYAPGVLVTDKLGSYPSAFSRSMLRSTTRLIFSATSSPAARSGSSGPKRQSNGMRRRSRPEPRHWRVFA